jgi:PAS domain S-box-containing protein
LERAKPVTGEDHTGDFEYDVVDQSPVGVTLCDPSREGVPVVYANDSFLAMTGYDRSEVLGRPWLAMGGPETSESAVERVRQAIEASESATVELRLQRADGDSFWDRVQIAPLTDDAGDVTSYVGFHEDVTAEKRRRETLEALHAAATRIQGAETVEAACQRTVDEAANVLDFDLCTVLLRDGEWLVPRANSADAPADGSRRMGLDQGLAGETHRSGQSRLVDDARSDETADPAKETYLSGLSVPVGEYGVFQAVGTETGAFDADDVELAELLVTHTASTLDQIERERELQRQNERLESFVSVVSHDLRNPLTVLSGALELAERTGDPEHFERGRRARDRMEQIIEDLLTLARQGESVEDSTPVDVAAAAGESWAAVATTEATLDVQVDLEVRCHEGRFRELLENLFRNAVEHGGERVSVTVGELPDSEGFYVADDGPGISPERREEVFQSGVSTSEDGTGFGLSIVDQIVAAHDWEIAVTESDAGGARFEVTTAGGVS